MRALRQLSRLLSRQTRSAPPHALRGTLRTAVVVKTPDARFSEALFVLREDSLHQKGITRQELLEQARAAAEGCTQELLPPGPAPMLHPAAAFLLGAAAAMLALWALGLL